MAPAVAGHFDPSTVVTADWMWTTIVNGHIPPWEVASDHQNRAMIRASVAAGVRMVAAGYSTVIEGVIGPWHWDEVSDEIAPVVEVASYVVLRPSLATCLRRAVDRSDRERGRPALRDPEPITQMWHVFGELGPFERHVVDTTLLDVEESVARVLGLLDTGECRLAVGDR